MPFLYCVAIPLGAPIHTTRPSRFKSFGRIETLQGGIRHPGKPSDTSSKPKCNPSLPIGTRQSEGFAPFT